MLRRRPSAGARGRGEGCRHRCCHRVLRARMLGREGGGEASMAIPGREITSTLSIGVGKDFGERVAGGVKMTTIAGGEVGGHVIVVVVVIIVVGSDTDG
jgi:hypothetical protein